MKLKYEKALKAQVALIELSKLNLPVKVSIQIARFANEIDREIKVLHQTRDNILRNYGINAKHGETEDSLSFSINSDETQEEKKAKLLEFVDKFKELLSQETNEIVDYKIMLPPDAIVKPSVLKALSDFVEVV